MGVGVTVMLEKVAEFIMANNLRAIFLMETAFNFMNKLVFGSRMMLIVRYSNLVPVEAFGGVKNKTAEEAVLLNTLLFDYIRQLRW